MIYLGNLGLEFVSAGLALLLRQCVSSPGFRLLSTARAGPELYVAFTQLSLAVVDQEDHARRDGNDTELCFNESIDNHESEDEHKNIHCFGLNRITFGATSVKKNTTQPMVIKMLTTGHRQPIITNTMCSNVNVLSPKFFGAGCLIIQAITSAADGRKDQGKGYEGHSSSL